MRMKSKLLLIDLKGYLDYDPLSGNFTWKVKRNRNTRIGAKAGTKRENGYVQIRLFGGNYLAHRLAWFYVSGEVPSMDIDHIDGDKSNNRISNLRLATKSQNLWNIATTKKNKLGVRNVYFDKRNQSYRVSCVVSGVRHNVGAYQDLELASLVAEQFREKAHGVFYREVRGGQIG